MKGIILAGGTGTRLFPITKGVSKQLLPVYDKPMIYYPLSVLMLAGIREILIISTTEDLFNYEKLLGNGLNLGIKLSYEKQPKPEGLAQAFIIGEKFIGNDDVCLVLGDNIFYGQGFSNLLNKALDNVKKDNATIFAYYVNDPNRYGVAELDDYKNVLSIEEKPHKPKSNFAVVGLYFYPNSVIKIAQKIKPSNRGELEITSVNVEYMKQKKLKAEIMESGFAWLDTGTNQSLSDASEFIKVLQNRQGLKIACLEEIALRKGFINKDLCYKLGEEMSSTEYGKYIMSFSKKWK